MSHDNSNLITRRAFLFNATGAACVGTFGTSGILHATGFDKKNRYKGLFASIGIASAISNLSLRFAYRAKQIEKKPEETWEERIAAFEERGKEYNERAAIHESGHAIAGILLGRKILELSILTEGSSGGSVLTTKLLGSQKAIYDDMIFTLAGKAAEELIYGKGNFDTGVMGDLFDAKHSANILIARAGMGELSAAYDTETENLSEATLQSIENQIEALINQAQDDAYALLKTYKDKIKILATAALKRKKMSEYEILDVTGLSYPKKPEPEDVLTLDQPMLPFDQPLL